ncbi:MAG: sulfur oxidation c-type cytochrome SoxX [Burkholderiales bacterium]|nr:sulfur oxidation c-type cytochrome SoxX [Burkholderiales bacterium]
MMLAAMAGCAVAAVPVLETYRIEGDAIHAPLGSATGDPYRGREVMAGRDANCLLCHAVAETGVRFMGDIAPPLSGVGARLSEGQLRLRIIDQSRLNPDTIMPSYYKVDGLVRVAPVYRGKPVLTAQQIEDIVAYLKTLK